MTSEEHAAQSLSPINNDRMQVLPKPAAPNRDIQPVSYAVPVESRPPRVCDMDSLTPWPMSLEEAVHIALVNSPVIRGAGGKVMGTTFDPEIFAADPNLGPDAARAAFDTRLTSSANYTDGGSLTSNAFGVYTQPTNKGELGLTRTFRNGARVRVGSFSGYDAELGGGLFAFYGGDVRQPLMRGAGTEFNAIAGPNARPGAYRGTWIAQLDADMVGLELEQAVRDLVRDVAVAYWGLYFSYHNLDAKKIALEHARQTWQHERMRVAERASPPDVEAIARQQYYSADAAVKNAIGGTGPDGKGVFDAETKLRALLALPSVDGRLIRPTAEPLQAELQFDWNESVQIAHARRIEVRRQLLDIEKRELELKAARNLRRPEIDLVGRYWRPATNSGQNVAFSGSLEQWQVGIEYSRTLGQRRENAALHNAKLRLSREKALLKERQRQVSAQLRSAFTELDRAHGVTKSLAISRAAARIRLQAEQKRHFEGQTDIDSVFDAQIRATQAETSLLRSLVDYNLAVINLHHVRGTLLDTLNVGFLPPASGD